MQKTVVKEGVERRKGGVHAGKVGGERRCEEEGRRKK